MVIVVADCMSLVKSSLVAALNNRSIESAETEPVRKIGLAEIVVIVVVVRMSLAKRQSVVVHCNYLIVAIVAVVHKMMKKLMANFEMCHMMESIDIVVGHSWLVEEL